MQKGDLVMTDHPDSRSRKFVRSYGIVQKITQENGVIIKMADGTLIKRRPNAIAVYIQPPDNWQELFERQIVVFSRQKPHILTPASRLKQKK